MVSGAGGGMGRAIARALGARGLKLGIADRDEGSLGETAELLEASGAAVLASRVDVSVAAEVEAWAEEVEARLGPISVAVAAAGALAPGAWALDAEDEDERRMWGVNYVGVANLDRAAARRMVASGGGRIVNVSSTAAVGASPGYAAYGAAKAAVESFTRTLAIELAPTGVTVNCIRPGWVDTPINAYFDADDLAEIESAIPVGRWGSPEDVADAVAFLAGEGSGWINGETISVDGGEVAALGRFDPSGTQRAIEHHRRWADERARGQR